MKNILFIVLSFICSVQGYNQVLNDSGNHGLMLITTKENDKLSELEGSPYLEEEFVPGSAMVSGKEPLNVFLRYNVYQEQVEIKLDPRSEEVYILPANKAASYKFGSEKLILEKLRSNGEMISGYFFEHFDGEKYRLLEKPTVTLTEAVKAKTGYEKDRPAQIKIEEEYYVVKENGEILNVRLKHRDIKKAFDSERSKEYLSDNKIRSEEDLISFITWLDRQ